MKIRGPTSLQGSEEEWMHKKGDKLYKKSKYHLEIEGPWIVAALSREMAAQALHVPSSARTLQPNLRIVFVFQMIRPKIQCEQIFPSGASFGLVFASCLSVWISFC
jgi:hypothetical protein